MSVLLFLQAVKPKSHRLANLYTSVQQMIANKDSWQYFIKVVIEISKNTPEIQVYSC